MKVNTIYYQLFLSIPRREFDKREKILYARRQLFKTRKKGAGGKVKSRMRLREMLDAKARIDPANGAISKTREYLFE